MRAAGIGGLIIFVLLGAGSEAEADQLLFAAQRLDLGDHATSGDRLGTSVAVSDDGNLLVTGAPLAGARGTQSGAVYTFARDPVSGDWGAAVGPLSGDDTTAFDAFGYSVALSADGNLLVVGAPLHDQPVANGGKVYVFLREAGATAGWRQVTRLTAAAEASEEDQLGTSVAVSADGSIIVAGAPQPNPRTRPPGKAYVFLGGTDHWSQQPVLSPAHEAFAFFGYAVAVDEGTVLVGAPGTGGMEAGAVYAFSSGDTVFRIDGRADGDELGVSVAAQEGAFVAGARAASGGAPQPGKVYLLSRQGGQWGLGDELTAGAEGDGLGMSVAVGDGGRTVLAGAWKDGSGAGAIDLFHREASGWSRNVLGSCIDPATGAELGRSVALGGPIVASGAHLATVNGKSAAGAVCSYDLSGLTVNVSASGVVAGDAVTYAITIHNTSNSQVSGITAIDRFDADRLVPPGLVCEDASCQPNGSAAVSWPVGTLEPGGQISFHLHGTVRPDAVGPLTNRVELQTPGFLDVTSNTTETTSQPPTISSDLSVDLKVKIQPKKANAPGQALRGLDDIIYTLTVRGSGPSAVTGVHVNEAFNLAALRSVSWCRLVQPGGACASPLQQGNIEAATSLSPGGRVAYQAIAVAKINTRVRDLVSTASIAGPGFLEDDRAENNTRSVTTILPVAQLHIGAPSMGIVVPGGPPVTFSISVTNGGQDDAPAVRIHTTFPEQLSAVHWSCAGSPIENGALDYTIPLLVGTSVSCTITVAAGPGAIGTGQVDFTATVPQGNFGNDQRTALATFSPVADLSAVVSDVQGVVPGSPLPGTLTVQVANAGPSDARMASVRTVLAADLGAVTWTCAALNGSCTPSGSGNLDDLVSLRRGGVLTYTFRYTVGAETFGTLVNQATVAAENGDPPPFTDPRAGNDRDEGTIQLTPVADLSIDRLEGPNPPEIVPGNPLPVEYTFEVANAGPSDARRARVTHHFSPGLPSVTWTCEAQNASCQPSGQGEVSDIVSLRVGGRLTYTVHVLAGAEQTGSQDVNARVKALPDGTDPRGANDNQTSMLTLKPVANLAITATVDRTEAIPGDPLPLVYTLRVSNAGPSDVRNATVSDTFPSALTSVAWTCQALRGSCATSGNGNVADRISLRAGGTLTYTIRALIDPAATGRLMTSANVACNPGDEDGHPPDCLDPRPGNDMAMAPAVSLTPVADLAVTMERATEDGDLIDTIRVTNAGPSDVQAAMVSETIAENVSWTWTCTALGGSCGLSGNAPIQDHISLRVGGVLTYKVNLDQTQAADRVTVDFAGDPRVDNNTATIP